MVMQTQDSRAGQQRKPHTIVSPQAQNLHLSKSRVGVLEEHLEVGLEPGTGLRGRLEGRLLSAEAVVADSGGVGGAIRLDK